MFQTITHHFSMIWAGVALSQKKTITTLTILSLISLTQLVSAQEHENLSFEELNQKVAGLKKTDVAWRNIPWKTCLIDGLNESKKQNKPILLWVFIDRPIDDERC